MNATIPGNPQRSNDFLYVIGYIVFALFILVLTYACYMCNRSQSTQEVVTISLGSTTNEYASNRHLLGFSRGLDDEVLVTFPTFLYSEATMPQTDDVNDSGCSICLVDYKPTDVVRILPECGHLFHVKCIDMWLKAHPTCPVCRNAPLPGTLLP